MEQIRISEKMAEYVENLEQVEHILNQCEYDLQYWTTSTRDKQHKYILYINDIAFKYFEGMGHEKLNDTNKQDKILNAIHCLLADRQCKLSCYNVDDFIIQYGYAENRHTMQNARFIWEEITKNNEKLLKCFNAEQLNFLTRNIQL